MGVLTLSAAALGEGRAAAKGNADVGGIRLGMTQEEVVAVCKQRPEITVHEVFAVTDLQGRVASIDTPPAERLTPPYLGGVMCESKAGVTQVEFSPPPGEPRAIAVYHHTFGASVGLDPDAYLARLGALHGDPVDQTASEPINPEKDSSSRRYKWLFAESEADADCSLRAPGERGDVFVSTLPGSGPCATQVTLQLAAQPGSVLAADFTLINVRSWAEAKDRSVADLNKQYGTHFPEGAMSAEFTRRIQTLRAAKRQPSARPKPTRTNLVTTRSAAN